MGSADLGSRPAAAGAVGAMSWVHCPECAACDCYCADRTSRTPCANAGVPGGRCFEEVDDRTSFGRFKTHEHGLGLDGERSRRINKPGFLQSPHAWEPLLRTACCKIFHESILLAFPMRRARLHGHNVQRDRAFSRRGRSLDNSRVVKGIACTKKTKKIHSR